MDTTQRFERNTVGTIDFDALTDNETQEIIIDLIEDHDRYGVNTRGGKHSDPIIYKRVPIGGSDE